MSAPTKPSPKRGRPRGNRTEKIQIRHTTADRAAWTLAAEVDGRTLSDWIRNTLDQAAAEILDGAAKGKR